LFVDVVYSSSEIYHSLSFLHCSAQNTGARYLSVE